MGQESSSHLELEHLIGYSFRSRGFLDKVSSRDVLDGKRYELLGDALIKFTLMDHLSRKYPDWNDFKISNKLDLLLNRDRSKEIVDNFHLKKFVNMEKSDKLILDSLIGVIYVDGGGEGGAGCKAVKKVIYKLWQLGDGAPETKKYWNRSLFHAVKINRECF
ncbi:ribonuclease 3 [Folsomia candida]|uniref:Ribonuclease 3 n=1 Tax=Folsomia candida TaxID=158441 RepID=A0A226DBP5_FOLCA|nr:ribonuclease 3 [Folsomia candida]OXA42264.1 Ribonuclease 3 [Folsomia candida]